MKLLLNSLALVVLACQAAPAAQDSVRILKTQSISDDDAAQDAARARGHAQITVDDDSHGALSLTLQRDGSIEATLDGQELSADRLVRDGDRLRVLGAGGELLYELQIFGDNRGLAYPYGEHGNTFRIGGIGLGGLHALEKLSSKPRHVIGVVTSPVSGGVAAQLGLEPDSALIINELTPDMPAAKAGLLPFDVITHIDGSAPVTRDMLRERVAAVAVGQPLHITLLRRGQPQELEVLVGETTDEVGRFPGSFMANLADDDERGAWNFAVDTLAVGPTSGSNESLARADVELTNARDSLQKRLEELRAKVSQGGVEGEAAAQAAAELDAALASVVEAQDSMRQHQAGTSPEVRFFNLGTDGDKGMLMRRPVRIDGTPVPWTGALATPGASSGSVESDARLQQMEARLAQLDARVAELVKALEAANKP